MSENITAKGVTGTVAFDGRMVTINRGKSEKRIPVAQVAAVQFKAASLTTRGFIQFTIPGGNEKTRRGGLSSTIDAAKDENSVLFKRSQEADFQAVRNAVEAAL